MTSGPRPSAARSRRCGVSLVELLVVLAILAGMLALLLPAVQQAREAGRSTICINNLRQLGIAAHSHFELAKQFPMPRESWTVTLLPWMEERPLADQLSGGNWQVAVGNRPPIFRCPSQPDPTVDESGVRSCHYMLEVSPGRKRGTVRGRSFHDRPADFTQRQLEPWYIGPLGTPGREDQGPHSGRRFNAS